MNADWTLVRTASIFPLVARVVGVAELGFAASSQAACGIGIKVHHSTRGVKGEGGGGCVFLCGDSPKRVK